MGCCRELIRQLRAHAPAHLYASSMSVPAVVQVMSALQVIRGQDGSCRGAEKLEALKENANYMRARLVRMGCTVMGTYDSPVLVWLTANRALLW